MKNTAAAHNFKRTDAGPSANSNVAIRRVTDDEGRTWDVWRVEPSLAERRSGADRRAAKRDAPERRVRVSVRLPLSGGLERGWLAFETHGERRRLAPPPTGWEQCPREALLEMLGRARRLPPRRRLVE